MYCGECGAKNVETDKFCAECGAPLQQEKQEEKQVVREIKPRQPMSKKNKIIILVVAIVVVLLGGAYKIGSDMTSPKKVADNYIKAVINNDADKLYKYLNLEGDTTFVSKDVFKTLLENSDDDDSTIESYKITDVEYGDGKLTAQVNFTYTIKDYSSESTSYVSLKKASGKKYLIFDNWKVADNSVSSSIVSDYTIKVSHNAKLYFAGIEVTDKYLDSDESTSKIDVYVLPQVFAAETTIKAVLENGIEIENEVTPSSYYDYYTVSFDEDSLSESMKETLINKAKEGLTTIYTSAINGKAFSDIKSSFEHGDLDLTDLETNYTEFLSDLSDNYNKLTSITFNDGTLYDIELNEDNYFEISVRITYGYTVEYTSWDDEVKTHSDTDYSYMTVVLAYDDGEYYIVDASDLETYFSRY